jgi:hypothetical protein
LASGRDARSEERRSEERFLSARADLFQERKLKKSVGLARSE